ncbi:hypothetical protein CLNEO_10000 [Anaerotignum neopropionicum]|uniref:Lipoprotein n=1 Tax=Anaerotignum neopropionicum TaxID=36847 RepID=A0A136WH22_9FIRM|nr:hypothetical protein [Anaerotignum neopropionicum]KXL53774.1 hypothetical protein CLNEO_10000 [Anaerotignum neopropionicum]
MRRYLWFVGLILALTFLGGCRDETAKSEMVLKLNDTLYYGTDEVGPMGDSGCVEGKITSSVELNSIPTENGSSNFGCIGSSYTYDYGDGFIMVHLNDEEWHCFYAENKE